MIDFHIFTLFYFQFLNTVLKLLNSQSVLQDSVSGLGEGVV